MKPILILKSLEKLYEKRESIDNEIAELAKKLITDTEKPVRTTRAKVAEKAIKKVDGDVIKKPRGRKPKAEKLTESTE